MRKMMMAALLLAVSVCFTGCGGTMASPQNAQQMQNMQSMQGMNMGK